MPGKKSEATFAGNPPGPSRDTTRLLDEGRWWFFVTSLPHSVVWFFDTAWKFFKRDEELGRPDSGGMTIEYGLSFLELSGAIYVAQAFNSVRLNMDVVREQPSAKLFDELFSSYVGGRIQGRSWDDVESHRIRQAIKATVRELKLDIVADPLDTSCVYTLEMPFISD